METGHQDPTSAARRPASATQLLAGDLSESLARFDDPTLLDGGKVTLVSLQVIAEKVGPKWALRQDQICEHAERTFGRIFGASGYTLRVSSTDFLVCQPDASRFVGQANSLKALREIIAHFVGVGVLPDIGIHRVTQVKPNSIVAHALAAAEIDANADVVEEEEEAGDKAAEPSSFITSTGREMWSACDLEAAYRLKDTESIGLRMGRHVTYDGSSLPLGGSQIALLPRADILRIDLGALRHGLQRLHSEHAQPLSALIAPVSFLSLTSLYGRADVVAAFQEIAKSARLGVIAEIHEIDGMLPGDLAAAVAAIKPYVLYVMGRLSHPVNPDPAYSVSLKGYSFDVNCAVNRELAPRAHPLFATLRRAGRAVMICGVRSEREAMLVRSLGATHTTLRSDPQQVIFHG